MKNEKIVLVAAKPVGNIPRMENFSEILNNNSFFVYQIGRFKPGFSKFRKKSNHEILINIELKVDTFQIPFKQPLILIEFLFRASALILRINPNCIISFYNAAAILFLNKAFNKKKKITWLLDFYHPNFLSIKHKIIEYFSELGWSKANAIVVPSRERLALHLTRNTKLISIKSFIIPNSPPSRKDKRAFKSIKLEEDIRIIYTGSVGKGYGLEAMILAVGESNHNIRLAIYGKKIMEPNSNQLIESQKGIEDLINVVGKKGNIDWLDAVPYSELEQIYQEYDFGFVTYEGQANLNDKFSAPGKLYDYVQQGLILITDNENPISNELEILDCGFLFPFPVTKEKITEILDKIVLRKTEIPRLKEVTFQFYTNHLALEKKCLPLTDFILEK